jgi:hypothetical protein
MTLSFETKSVETGTGLEAIILAIASSPIVVRRAAIETLLADWETTRRSPDIDAVILDWIASHARPRNPAALS